MFMAVQRIFQVPRTCNCSYLVKTTGICKGVSTSGSKKSDYQTLERLKHDSELCRQFMQTAKFVVLSDRKYLVEKNSAQRKTSLYISNFEELLNSKMSSSVLLTVENNTAIYATSASDVNSFLENGKQLIEPRPALFMLSERDQGLATMGLNLLQWQQDNRYCSRCRSELTYHISGRSCRCDSCKQTYFPRYNPVVIMLVVCGDYCLLGRNRQFPSKMFSCLAGFIDVGECVEAAVVREVCEEVGVDVNISQVRYSKSDFWGGFRQNYSPELMLGCVATVNEMQQPECTEEIVEARWFHKDEIQQALERSKIPGFQKGNEGLMLPPPFATAHKLADKWCNASV